MNLFFEIRELVIGEIAALQAGGGLPGELDTAGVAVEAPRDPLHGDMATNAAMVLAKQAGTKPRDIAETLASRLEADSRVASAEVAGPGFVNLRLESAVYRDLVRAILAQGPEYGRPDFGKGRRASVEFVSANPTGPLHVGHCRGAVFGDALARLLAWCGHDVTREYWVNDGGAQVDILARSAFERYREAHGQEPEIGEGLYPGDYLVAVGVALKERFGDSLLGHPEAEWIDRVRDVAVDMMMDSIRADLAALGVEMDLFVSERDYREGGKIEATLDDLGDRGLVYLGVLEPPKGKPPPDGWEPREQTLFRSTAHGDDVDRPVRKSDGSWTYFAPDLAYHHDKIRRGFDLVVDVFGADHGGYVKRMTAVMTALDERGVEFDIKLCQLVNLLEDGKPLKMSKRAGNFVTLRDVLDQVGPDVTRFVMLTRRNDAPLDFDFARVREQSRENPVFYVQYAAARTASVSRKAKEAGIETDDQALAGASLAALGHDADLSVARKLSQWPRSVEAAARAHEPHRIAFFLQELAAEFHSLWNLGNDDESLRFVQEGDADASQDRIALARAVSLVISSGLGILGVKPVEEMR